MSYTVITGASAGIGSEFAKQLAQTGQNLILVARRKEKLEELAQTLQTQHGIVVTGIKNQVGVLVGKVSPRFMTRKIAGWLQA